MSRSSAAAEPDFGRLHQVWDLIDSRQFRAASRQIQQLMHKFPQSQNVRALHAYMLARQDNPQRARELADEVALETPIDRLVLLALVCAYRLIGDSSKVLPLYENAFRVSPVEEMGEDLFSFLCQERKFGNMQRLAMQLGKKYGDLEPKYMFWVAASCLLQAEFDDNVQSLGLGTMFFQKQIDAQLVQSDEQVRLFVMMLHRLDRFDDIITILCGSLGKLYRFRADRLRDLADAFKNAKRWVESNATLCYMLEYIDRDDWNSYREFFDTLLPLSLLTDTDISSTVCLSLEGYTFESALLQKEFSPSERTDCDSDSDDEGLASESRGILTVFSSPMDVLNFIHSLQQAERDSISNVKENSTVGGGLARGPFLAEIELRKRFLELASCLEKDSESESRRAQILSSLQRFPSLCDLCVQYFLMFGSKPSTIHDLRDYFTEELFALEIQTESYVPIAEAISRIEESLSTEPDVGQALADKDVRKEFLSHIQKRKVLESLRRSAGLFSFEDEKSQIQKVFQLFEEYCRLLVFDPIRSDSREFQSGDEFLHLAILYLLDIFRHRFQGKNSSESLSLDICSPLFLISALLEKAIGRSSNYFQFKLLLLRVYAGYLGATGCAVSTLESLDLKNLQLESLMYLCIPDFQRLCATSSLESVYEMIQHFHEQHLLQSPEIVFYPFKFGSYSKVIEMARFKERLENSVIRVESEVDKIFIGLRGQSQTPQILLEYLNNSITRCNVREIFAQSIMLGSDTSSCPLRCQHDLGVIETFDQVHVPPLSSYREGIRSKSGTLEFLLPPYTHPLPEQVFQRVGRRYWNAELLYALFQALTELKSLVNMKVSVSSASAKKKDKGRKQKISSSSSQSSSSSAPSTLPSLADRKAKLESILSSLQDFPRMVTLSDQPIAERFHQCATDVFESFSLALVRFISIASEIDFTKENASQEFVSSLCSPISQLLEHVNSSSLVCVSSCQKLLDSFAGDIVASVLVVSFSLGSPLRDELFWCALLAPLLSSIFFDLAKKEKNSEIVRSLESLRLCIGTFATNISLISKECSSFLRSLRDNLSSARYSAAVVEFVSSFVDFEENQVGNCTEYDGPQSSIPVIPLNLANSDCLLRGELDGFMERIVVGQRKGIGDVLSYATDIEQELKSFRG